jgi:hypothetical protein
MNIFASISETLLVYMTDITACSWDEYSILEAGRRFSGLMSLQFDEQPDEA